MTSTIVPPVDLAPGMPSRVVTISATDVTEGGKSMAGATVTFALSDSLDASGGVVIAKTQATVTLDSNGNGRIRVPVYTPDAKTWCGSSDWAVLVSASWGSQKAIRVPAGATSIALSALPSIRPLRGRELQWAVTGASVSVTEGAQWDASVSLSGGVLDFDFTVPPGGVAYYRGVLGTSNLNDVTETGLYAQPHIGNVTPERNYPVQQPGILNVVSQSGYTWQVYSGDAIGGAWKRKASGGNWLPWESATSTIQNRGLLGSTDLNDATEDGFWHQQHSSIPSVEINYPVDTSGVLLVTSSGAGRLWQTYTADAQRGVFQRVRANGVWGEWDRIASTILNHGLVGTLDLNDAIREGTWYQRYPGNIIDERNYPVQGVGQLEVRVLASAIGAYSQEYYPDDMALGRWRRVSRNMVWTPWHRIDGGGDGDTPSSSSGTAVQRLSRVSIARKRLLGGHGTRGQAAVSFRFDDGHAAFGELVFPLLRKHALPSFAAITERHLDASGVSNTAVQQWAINDAVEITSHSRKHATETGESAIRDSLVTWADELQSRVGHVVVDTWTFPSNGYFDGLDSGRQAQYFPDTYAGRLLMERFAMPYGVTGGWLSPICGEPTVGQSHITIETMSLAEVQSYVGMAQDAGMGLVMMVHPSRLNTPGYMTTATLDQVFAWVAGEREAGRLSVLTGTGIGFAHKGDSANMLPRLSSWTGTGWGSGEERSTTGTSTLTTDVTINGFAATRGAPVELSFEVDGDSGTQVQIALSAPGLPLDTTRTVTLTGTGWQRVYNVATIPSGMGFGTSFTASVRKTTAGALTVRAPRLTTI